MTNYSNVVEANSDSDDEDKLHIVEEESLPDTGDCDSNVPDDDAALGRNGPGDLEDGWEEGEAQPQSPLPPLFVLFSHSLALALSLSFDGKRMRLNAEQGEWVCDVLESRGDEE